MLNTISTLWLYLYLLLNEIFGTLYYIPYAIIPMLTNHHNLHRNKIFGRIFILVHNEVSLSGNAITSKKKKALIFIVMIFIQIFMHNKKQKVSIDLKSVKRFYSASKV